MQRWIVWRVTYATCQEVEQDGDVPPKQVSSAMTLEQALALVARLGFGHCAKPE